MEPIWTKEAVEKEIRSLKRTCRGRCVLPLEAQKAINDRWKQIIGTEWVEAVSFQLALESALSRGGHLDVPDNDWEMMNRYIRGLWDSRVGCGQDINDIILAGPLDGEIHTYTCPRCGIIARYIPGVFEGVPSL